MAITEAATVPVTAPRIAPTSTTAKARPPGTGAEELARALEQVLREAASFQDRPEEGEERDREQKVVRHDAERPVGQRLQELRSEIADLDRQHPEEEAERRQREGDRKAEEQEETSPREHRRGHVAVF